MCSCSLAKMNPVIAPKAEKSGSQDANAVMQSTMREIAGNQSC